MKLTPAQRALLKRAMRSPSGNPWPGVSMSERSGGSLLRMFERMQDNGLFDRDNCITDVGRGALLQESHEVTKP